MGLIIVTNFPIGKCCHTITTLLNKIAPAPVSLVQVLKASGKTRVLLKKVLGEGKSGTVWEGELNNQRVAVKVGTCLAADDVLKWERTAYEALAPLQGTVLPRLFGLGWTSTGRRFLILEQIVGQTLDQVRQTLHVEVKANGFKLPIRLQRRRCVEELSSILSVQGSLETSSSPAGTLSRA